jgi:hypothetical protein
LAHEEGSGVRPSEPGRRAYRRAAKIRALTNRRRTRLIATGVVGLVVLFAAGVELGLDRLAEFGRAAATPRPAASPLDAPVLGSQARPSPTAGATATSSPPPIIASVPFDLYPVGPLTARPPVARVIGTPEIVPFPSPLDRSLELAGGTESGVCVGVPGLRSDPLAVVFDLYGEALATGTVMLAVDAADAPGVALAIAQSDLVSLPAQEWLTVALHWDGDAGGTLEGRMKASGEVVAQGTLQPFEQTTSSDQAACLVLTAASAEVSVRIDNLRIER